MEISVVKHDKDELEFNIDNQTVAEVLRVYLNEQGVKFAAWKRDHPTIPVFMRVQASSGTVKKAISEAVDAIKKDADKLLSVVKKK